MGKLAEAGDSDWTMEDCPKMLQKLSVKDGIEHFLTWKTQFLDYVERYQFPNLFDIKAEDFLAAGDELLDPQLEAILLERVGSDLEKFDHEDLAEELHAIFDEDAQVKSEVMEVAYLDEATNVDGCVDWVDENSVKMLSQDDEELVNENMGLDAQSVSSPLGKPARGEQPDKSVETSPLGKPARRSEMLDWPDVEDPDAIDDGCLKSTEEEDCGWSCCALESTQEPWPELFPDPDGGRGGDGGLDSVPHDRGGKGGDGGNHNVKVLPREEVHCGLAYFALFEAVEACVMLNPLPDNSQPDVDVLSDPGGRPRGRDPNWKFRNRSYGRDGGCGASKDRGRSRSGALQGRRCRRRCRANRSRFRGYIKKANTIKKHGARVPNKTITFSETKRPHRGILGRTSQNQKNPNWMKQRTFCSSVVPERSKRLSKKCSASFIYSDLLKICI